MRSERIINVRPQQVIVWLGVDQSLNATGVCVLAEDGRVVEIRTVVYAVGGASDVKLLGIRNALLPLLPTAKFGAIEGYAYDSIHRAFDLGEVAGTVKLALVEHRVGYVTVPPVTLKLYATGSSRAEKGDMIAAAVALGAQPADDNQADAFFLAHLARAHALGTARKRCEMEALYSLRRSISGKQNKPKRRVRRLVKNAI